MYHRSRSMRTLWFCFSAAILSTACLQAQTNAQPSFNCANVKDQSVEQAICNNPTLSQLDLEMAGAYRKRLDSASNSERQTLTSTQQQWLRIRNTYDVNPYFGDPEGLLSDLADLYKDRIATLGSADPARLTVNPPAESDWLYQLDPSELDKRFSIGRAFMGCKNPCEENPALYKVVSINSEGVGPLPGDIDTPYRKIVTSLRSQGWSQCRTADGDAPPTADFFRKNMQRLAIFRFFSMGAGSSIRVTVSTSEPLPQKPPKIPPDQPVAISDDWPEYVNGHVGLDFRYPPGFEHRESGSSRDSNSAVGLLLTKKMGGSFQVSLAPNGGRNYQPDGEKCLPSRYRVSGLPARQCMHEEEQAANGTCNRYIHTIEVDAPGGYRFTLEPYVWGSFPDQSGEYRLSDLYEKILSTVKLTGPSN